MPDVLQVQFPRFHGMGIVRVHGIADRMLRTDTILHSALSIPYSRHFLSCSCSTAAVRLHICFLHRNHLCISVLFIGFILLFKAVNNKSVIDAIYTIASYTYGPLLGLFAFGLFTPMRPRDRFVPYIAIASPLLCYAIDRLFSRTVYPEVPLLRRL